MRCLWEVSSRAPLRSGSNKYKCELAAVPARPDGCFLLAPALVMAPATASGFRKRVLVAVAAKLFTPITVATNRLAAHVMDVPMQPLRGYGQPGSDQNDMDRMSTHLLSRAAHRTHRRGYQAPQFSSHHCPRKHSAGRTTSGITRGGE